MSLNQVLKSIDQLDRSEAFRQIFHYLSKEFLYFHLIDDGSFSEETEIVQISKERPVAVPIVVTDEEKYSVLFVSKSMALDRKTNDLKLCYLKGLRALKHARVIKDTTGVVIQGTENFVALSKSEIDELLNIKL